MFGYDHSAYVHELSRLFASASSYYTEYLCCATKLCKIKAEGNRRGKLIRVRKVQRKLLVLIQNIYQKKMIIVYL